MEHNHNHCRGSSSGEELLALLRYMVAHNESHTKELEELAKQLDGDSHVYEHIKTAIEQYQCGNANLAAALEHLEGK